MAGVISSIYQAHIVIADTQVSPVDLSTSLIGVIWTVGFLAATTAPPVSLMFGRDHWGRTLRRLMAIALATPVAFGVLCRVGLEDRFFDDGFALALVVTGTGVTLAITILWFTTRLRDEDVRRRRAEELYRTIVEASHEGICVGDDQGRLVFANGRLCEMLGMAPSDLHGRVLVDLVAREDRGEAQARLGRRRGDLATAQDDVRLVGAGGTTIDTIISSTTLRDADGRFTGVVGLITDITARKVAARALERAHDLLAERVTSLEGAAATTTEDTAARVEQLARRLAAANTELETFSYSVSHDLRAPLRSIDGFSRELQLDYGDVLDERGRHYLDRTREATKRMARLIDALLDLARLSRRPMVREHTDLSEIAGSVAADLHDRAPDRLIEFRIAREMTVSADPHLVRILLENLLGNAQKFTTKAESAVIEVGATMDGSIFVRDNGVGFDQADADKLFAPFQRLHTAEFEGTGIGLAIVQRIVHRHGGVIRAEAVAGRGATFFFTLGDGGPAIDLRRTA
jgi:PAS domain S-box-containing protein